MSVAHDAASNVAGGSTTRSWTHTPVGTPRGVIVLITEEESSEKVSGVTYGGVALTQIAKRESVFPTYTIGLWFLGTGIPTGAQTVVATVSGGSGTKRCVCATVTASGDTDLRTYVSSAVDMLGGDNYNFGMSPTADDASYGVALTTTTTTTTWPQITTEILEHVLGSTGVSEYGRAAGTTDVVLTANSVNLHFEYVGAVVKEVPPTPPRLVGALPSAAVRRAAGW